MSGPEVSAARKLDIEAIRRHAEHGWGASTNATSNARFDVLAVLDALESERAESRRMTEALEFYADEQRWVTGEIGPMKARMTLAAGDEGTEGN